MPRTSFKKGGSNVPNIRQIKYYSKWKSEIASQIGKSKKKVKCKKVKCILSLKIEHAEYNDFKNINDLLSGLPK